MRLKLCTWPDVEAYLKKSKGIIVPIGSCEQHGPTGLIGTDAICPEEIAWVVGDQSEILVAPTLSYGMAQHHLGFPGSITFRPTTLIAVVKDVVHSLARHGFERIYFLNGHGGNIPIVHSAFQEIYAERSLLPSGGNDVRCRLANWFAGPQVTALSAELFGKEEGYHATPSEVSLTWYAYPDKVRDLPLEPIEDLGTTFYDCNDYRRRFPDGRMAANSALASVEHGERFMEAGVAYVTKDYAQFLEAP